MVEITLPETEPETEWVRGRALRKVSPKRDHARVQLALATALDAWAAGRGEVGTEWRFRVAPPGEPRRPLVPDVAFVANARLSGHSDEDLQVPAFAPTIVAEVLSASDEPADVRDKIRTYLRAGTALAIVADPRRRTLVAHDARETRTFAGSDVFRHAAMPDFELRLDAFFAAALDRLPGAR